MTISKAFLNIFSVNINPLSLREKNKTRRKKKYFRSTCACTFLRFWGSLLNYIHLFKTALVCLHAIQIERPGGVFFVGQREELIVFCFFSRAKQSCQTFCRPFQSGFTSVFYHLPLFFSPLSSSLTALLVSSLFIATSLEMEGIG